MLLKHSFKNQKITIIMEPFKDVRRRFVEIADHNQALVGQRMHMIKITIINPNQAKNNSIKLLATCYRS